MPIETSLRTLLLSQPSVTDLVPEQVISGVSFPGVFCEFPAQKFVPPYILIAQIDFDPMKCLDGTTGMETTEIDIDCYHNTHAKALILGKAVSDLMKDYSGIAGSDRINAVLWNNKRHDLISVEGTDRRYHVIGLSFQIQHTAL